VSDREPKRVRRGADAESEPYWKAAHEGRLIVQRCTVCGPASSTPLRCLRCRARSSGSRHRRGDGVHFTSSGRLLAFVSHLIPYVVALVDLDEGHGS